jgi:hypothetical protein
MPENVGRYRQRRYNQLPAGLENSDHGAAGELYWQSAIRPTSSLLSLNSLPSSASDWAREVFPVYHAEVVRDWVSLVECYVQCGFWDASSVPEVKAAMLHEHTRRGNSVLKLIAYFLA